ncbi:NADPH-dependent ferric siderophore reductase [Haloactinopolyspora alba]|uniref:NADPH-dependent ferric siderophore reductase n=1 Tax=Haloactinopolyspora alba TaxID=648780 RepID=A0A2P8EC43_9ACTN|nr:siderophore-interacting protein [Haloactinopolyspora alba]PSL07032.1 NADPH-dependent ferric siderophore reductase [Haloactinopolyspora alba]
MSAHPDRRDPAPKVAAHHRHGAGLERIPYPIDVRTVTVAAREYVTPRMLRLTLGGAGLDGVHTYEADDHVKIVFPDDDGTLRAPVPDDRLMLDWPRPMPTTREYTIRHYDAAERRLDLDLVLHDGGLAATWATTVPLGAPVVVAGPPGAKAFPRSRPHYVFAVDATGLPAVSRWLDESPLDVSADIVVETAHEDEHAYPLAHRDGVRVTRLIRRPHESALAGAVWALDVPAGTFLFAAGEADDIKPLRSWASSRQDASITGYWKRGVAGFDD